MKHSIVNATANDLPFIYHLFEEAILFQKKNNYIGWNNYDKAFIQADVQNGLLYKMIGYDKIIGIFSICHSDVLIWRNKEKGDAIYLHRLVLNQEYKGIKVFQQVLDWAIEFVCKNNLTHIRIDTWAANEKLIAYYRSYGFAFIENYTTPDTDDLPLQHRNLHVALLELTVSTPVYDKQVHIKDQQ